MKYKMWTIRMLAAMLMMMCGFTLGGMSSHASTKSNMDKMVNNFCKAKYKKASMAHFLVDIYILAFDVFILLC